MGGYIALNISPEIITFAISLIPVIELRGAIPYGASMQLPYYMSFILSVIGNMLPVPFLILFVRKIFDWLRKIKLFKKLVDWMERRVLGKQDVLAKYEKFGLAIFVAIPLPGTGAWTGAMLAGLLGMRMKDSLPAIFIGVIVAALIVTAVSYGFIGAIDFLGLHA
ncbi:MAG: small multi-drug export protein [Oscillospiraceae bacterium]|nr:small multi-drug export protein [Oscillospiraceae bacterium]